MTSLYITNSVRVCADGAKEALGEWHVPPAKVGACTLQLREQALCRQSLKILGQEPCNNLCMDVQSDGEK